MSSTRMLKLAALVAAMSLSLHVTALQGPAPASQASEAIFSENAIQHPVWAKNGKIGRAHV